ncbi:hypothetical protein O181_017596 [Austropuccinia psidii MF-1]|uniref:GB1/RHD3-type G domain-containing protein n=1 Tax=Austropuccinia psidii MF-1 TaxID=1389203 RepID=A0A9Q3GS45_9BASI|nr:hypothetical protein [Austropuccinia psidii MF-1]
MVNHHESLNGLSKDTEQVQVIGEDQRFSVELPNSIKDWGLLEKGFNYDLVAVFGSQSTGKSTLLNKVFGTTFDVMNEAERRQTTKGIWMCKGKGMDVLVMDVEGADGRERGENQDFERKAALFSMASSEVIIVNMWEHQVGLYQGANMGLLRTVFEVDLALFQANKAKQNKTTSGYDKTHLLFVIRDHVGTTPLSNLENTITNDLNRIWDALVKPEGTENSKITDYFDLTFTALSHKVLQPENFDRDVEVLRKRFLDKSHPDYVFKPIYHKRIPADGLAQYMSGIWDAVVTNKDLDLPTQQELLAQFRCDEIAATSFQQFNNLIQPLKTGMESGKVMDDLGIKMSEARKVCLDSFDLAASRYHIGVYQRKRIEFMTKMHSSLSPLFLTQLKNSSKSIIKKFQAELVHQLKTGASGKDFGEVVSIQMEAAEKEFQNIVKLVLLDQTDWTYDEQLLQLKEDLATISNQCKVDEMKKLIGSIEKEAQRQINEVVELAMAHPNKELWDEVLQGFASAVKAAEEKYQIKSASFSCTKEEDQQTLAVISRKTWIGLRSKIDEQTADSALLIKLKLAFEEKFRYDADGVPRVWKPEDDIDGAFRDAREATLDLIPIYANIQPTNKSLESYIPSNSTFETEDQDILDYDFDGSRIVLSATKQADLVTRLKKESDAYYLEAKRSLVSSISQIPYWMYGVIGVLGWNEFLAILRSPVYFTTVIMLAVGFWLTFRLNLQGPMLAIGAGVYRETTRVAHDKLKEYFQEADVLQPSSRLQKKRSITGLSQNSTSIKNDSQLNNTSSANSLGSFHPTNDFEETQEISLNNL